MRPRLAVVTCAEYPDLCDDDRRLVSALADAGVDAAPVVWDREARWPRYDGALLRSPWDYFLALPAFLAWLDGLARAGVPCWNDPALVRWNADKRYLRALEARGVPTVPTLWFDAPPAPADLAARVADAGWDEVVVKPTVSAGAWRTVRCSARDLRATTLPPLPSSGGAGWMVQPFLPEIVTDGELAFVFVEGAFSHAVRKEPKAGDFRVQWTHGGRETPVAASLALVAQAAAALAAAPDAGLYARVDGVVRDGRLWLMELELIEPYLYFGHEPTAAPRLAAALARRLRA
jgi:glutathione synthase/RimK-type ligase-like ATP-grasp enzyme